jgi:hypothetical protein
MHKWNEKMHDRTGIADLKRACPQNEFRRVVADDDTSQLPPKQHNQEICKLGNKEKAQRGGRNKVIHGSAAQRELGKEAASDCGVVVSAGRKSAKTIAMLFFFFCHHRQTRVRRKQKRPGKKHSSAKERESRRLKPFFHGWWKKTKILTRTQSQRPLDLARTFTCKSRSDTWKNHVFSSNFS